MLCSAGKHVRRSATWKLTFPSSHRKASTLSLRSSYTRPTLSRSSRLPPRLSPFAFLPDNKAQLLLSPSCLVPDPATAMMPRTATWAIKTTPRLQIQLQTSLHTQQRSIQQPGPGITSKLPLPLSSLVFRLPKASPELSSQSKEMLPLSSTIWQSVLCG